MVFTKSTTFTFVFLCLVAIISANKGDRRYKRELVIGNNQNLSGNYHAHLFGPDVVINDTRMGSPQYPQYQPAGNYPTRMDGPPYPQSQPGNYPNRMDGSQYPQNQPGNYHHPELSNRNTFNFASGSNYQLNVQYAFALSACVYLMYKRFTQLF